MARVSIEGVAWLVGCALISTGCGGGDGSPDAAPAGHDAALADAALADAGALDARPDATGATDADVEPAGCVDTDRRDFHVRGTVTVGEERHEDYCHTATGTTLLREFFCAEDGSRGFVDREIPAGYRCREGRLALAPTTGDQLGFFYGSLEEDVATPLYAAERLAVFDIVVITNGVNTRATYLDEHGERVPNPDRMVWEHGDCNSRGYRADFDWAGLVGRLRSIHPDILLFGYVASTADNRQPDADPRACWSFDNPVAYACPPAGCTDFERWVGRWEEIGVDGIFMDLVFSIYLQPATRDRLFEHVSSRGLRIMANIGYGTANIGFASASPHIGRGDFLFAESFYLESGAAQPALAESVGRALRAARERTGVGWTAWAKEPSGVNAPCDVPRRRAALEVFRRHGGDGFFYGEGDGGRETRRIFYCRNSY